MNVAVTRGGDARECHFRGEILFDATTRRRRRDCGTGVNAALLFLLTSAMMLRRDPDATADATAAAPTASASRRGADRGAAIAALTRVVAAAAALGWAWHPQRAEVRCHESGQRNKRSGLSRRPQCEGVTIA